jgi:hypothetical protein
MITDPAILTRTTESGGPLLFPKEEGASSRFSSPRAVVYRLFSTYRLFPLA